MKKIIFLCIIILFSCSTNVVMEKNVKSVKQAKLSKEDRIECEMLNSFGYENYNNQSWEDAIINYKDMIDVGCSKEYPDPLYLFMGRSYIELGKNDSANIVFKQGLKYLDKNEDILMSAAWNARKLGSIDEQITYLDRWLSLNQENTEALSQLSDVYRDNEMYQEQVEILDQWLTVEPKNKKANAEKKAAFRALGKDELDVDRERWEADPSNIQYGIDYINGLKNKGLDTEVINICNSLLVYEKYNAQILTIKAESYLNLYEEELALEIYLILDNLISNDYEIAIEISQIYINKEEYQTAVDWANKAIKRSENMGVAFYQRAEVYYNVAESCAKENLSFSDKVVFEIAWEDYNNAINFGYLRAKTRADFLYENNITTIGDWFINVSDNEVESKPTGECYSWIERKIKRKE